MENIFAVILSAFDGEQKHYEKNLKSLQILEVNGVRYRTGQYLGKNIVLGCTGMGTSSCAAAATHALISFKPKYVYFSGTSGAIDPTLKIGDVVIGRNALDADILEIHTAVIGTPFESALIHPIVNKQVPRVFEADTDLLHYATEVAHGLKFKSQVGLLATSNYFPSPPNVFKKVKKENALTMDMESSAFYQIAWIFGAKALAVRGVSNELDAEGNDENVASSKVDLSASHAAQVVLSTIECTL